MDWFKSLLRKALTDREVFLTIMAPILVSLLSSMVAGFVFKGPVLLVFIVTAAVFVVLFSISLGMLWQRSLTKMEHLFDTRLPPGEFDMQVENQELAEQEVANVVRNAERLIMATGSKSRVEKYLAAIEEKLRMPGANVYYTRVLMGDAVTAESCQHLCRILSDEYARSQVRICRLDRTDLGYFTVTDNGFYAFFPSLRDGAPLENYLRVLYNKRVIEFFREYISRLAYDAEYKNLDQGAVRRLCEVQPGSDGRCPKCGVIREET